MLCVASHIMKYHIIVKEKRDWTSCEMLLQGIPELISYREINEVLTQFIVVHSLFKSFQNTAINDTSPLLSSWRYGTFWWILQTNESHLIGQLSKLIFLGHDFQHLSFLLNSSLFCFSSRCI